MFFLIGWTVDCGRAFQGGGYDQMSNGAQSPICHSCCLSARILQKNVFRFTDEKFARVVRTRRQSASSFEGEFRKYS